MDNSFEKICELKESFLKSFTSASYDEIVSGLNDLEVAALTAAIHAETDFKIWCAQKRKK